MKARHLVVAVALLIGVLQYKRGPFTEPLFHLEDPNSEQSADRHYDPDRYPPYIPENIKAPALYGLPLKAFVTLLELPLIGDLLVDHVMRDNGYPKVRQFAAAVPHANPLYFPHTAPTAEDGRVAGSETAAQQQRTEILDTIATKPTEGDEQPKISGESLVLDQYVKPYVAKTRTPVEVVERTIEAITKSGQLKAFVKLDVKGAEKAAEESAKRYAAGKPLSLLDGVPVAVKTECAVKGLPRTMGTSFLDHNVQTEDSVPVRKLRAAGAIIVGVTNMHEIGLGTTGYNAYVGSVRNPFNLSYHTGGSSSGSAAAVAAGLVPVAVAEDGGGSIRIPATLCGQFGLKATFGRITVEGGGLVYTVGHAGPVATTARDALIAYDIMAAPDHQKDGHINVDQPPVHFSQFGNRDLKGVRIGIVRGWSDDASAEQQQAFADAKRILQRRGAEFVHVTFPYFDILFRSHTVSIIGEMIAGMAPHDINRTLHGWQVRSTLALARSFTSLDYVSAQIARRWFYDTTKGIFKRQKLDAILTVASGRTAPPIHLEGEAAGTGELNLALTEQLMRHHVLGNMVGLPGIVIPMPRPTTESKSTSGSELPVGVQLMSNHWREDVLLRLADVLEYDSQSIEKGGRRRPLPSTHYLKDIFP